MSANPCTCVSNNKHDGECPLHGRDFLLREIKRLREALEDLRDNTGDLDDLDRVHEARVRAGEALSEPAQGADRSGAA
jgi:hypothetical protein